MAILMEIPSQRHATNHWNDVLIDLKSKLQDILPTTLSMCREMERVKNAKKKIHFLPTRTSNIPCHAKFDTETMAQMFVPYKERVEARKSALDREDYNDWVWTKVVDWSQMVFRKMKGFKFHHEISTDGVAVSILFSRRATGKPARPTSGSVLWKKQKGLDPRQSEWIPGGKN